jgi:hypothetical protein
MTRRAQFLASRVKCPACGAPRKSERRPEVRARFSCGTVFVIEDGAIAVARPCPARCLLAAELWNVQTRELSI